MQKTNVSNLKIKEDSIKVFKDRLGRSVGVIENLQLSSSKELYSLKNDNIRLKESLRKFKKVNSLTQVKTKVVIKDKFIPFVQVDTIVKVDTIYLTKDASIEFKEQTKDFSISGSVTLKGLEIDALIVPNEQTIVIGEYKGSPWQARVLSTTIVNSNPNIINVGLETHQIIIPKKWYEKPYITIPIGLLGGVILWETLR